MKSYFKSKTMWAAFGVTMLGAVQAIFADAPMDPQYAGLITGAIGVGMAFLRSITTTAVGGGA